MYVYIYIYISKKIFIHEIEAIIYIYIEQIFRYLLLFLM